MHNLPIEFGHWNHRFIVGQEYCGSVEEAPLSSRVDLNRSSRLFHISDGRFDGNPIVAVEGLPLRGGIHEVISCILPLLVNEVGVGR